MDKRNNFIVLWISLSICALIFADVYVLPQKSKQLLCSNAVEVSRPLNRMQQYYYFLEANGQKYGVSEDVYDLAIVGQKINIIKSFIGANMFIVVENTKGQAKCNIQFIGNSGIVFLMFATIGILSFMFFYEKIPYRPGAKYLAIFFLLMSVTILILHLIGSAAFLP